MMSSKKGRFSSAAFTRYLIEAAGLGASAAALAGCGGNVVVDTGGGGSDATTTTGTTTSATTTTTTTTTTVECEPTETIYGVEVVCSGIFFPSTGCPPFDTPALFEDLWNQVQNEGCGGGDLANILCGPLPGDPTSCCYQVDAQILLCGGRPFMIDGAPRVAEVEGRADWMAPTAEVGRGVDEISRATLAAAWTESALEEHASIASFARFSLELLAVGAPSDIVAATQRALGDEVKHAEVCFGLASRYARRSVGPSALAIPGGDARVDLASIAAAAVREGCVGETIAAFHASAAREEATDTAVRRALDLIARDEAAHAALAYRFVAWARARGDARVRDAIDHAFEAAIAAPPPSPPEREGNASVLRAHGLLSAAKRRALTAQCLAEVIAPSAAALRAGGAGAEPS